MNKVLILLVGLILVTQSVGLGLFFNKMDTQQTQLRVLSERLSTLQAGLVVDKAVVDTHPVGEQATLTHCDIAKESLVDVTLSEAGAPAIEVALESIRLAVRKELEQWQVAAVNASAAEVVVPEALQLSEAQMSIAAAELQAVYDGAISRGSWSADDTDQFRQAMMDASKPVRDQMINDLILAINNGDITIDDEMPF